MKDKIIIWTPDLPNGYGVTDQDEEEVINEINEDDEILTEI